MTSAAHLAEHLAEVPVLVIPTIIGRHDGSGRPWVTLSSLAAIPLTTPLSSGYGITRTVAPGWRRSGIAGTSGDRTRRANFAG